MEPTGRHCCNDSTTRLAARPALRRAGVALVLSLSLLSGCVALDGFVHKPEELPTGPVCHAVATWNKEVVFPPDPVNNGRPTPGLTGRLYLFGPEIKESLVGDGSLALEMYVVESPSGGNGRAAPADYQRIERWEFDRHTLRRLLRKDPIGWGYTLFLPWGKYKPELTQVKLRLCYQPQHGTPLYTENQMTLTRVKGN